MNIFYVTYFLQTIYYTWTLFFTLVSYYKAVRNIKENTDSANGWGQIQQKKGSN